MGLAQWIVDSDNPLTARVAVNRFWAQLFGIGIVETQEDFGTQGQPPAISRCSTGWLSSCAVTAAWDMKRTGPADRHLGGLSPVLARDARVLAEGPGRTACSSRGPRKRLEAELVRDQALALSGLLSPKMFGPSVFPPQPDGLWQAAFNGERT